MLTAIGLAAVLSCGALNDVPRAASFLVAQAETDIIETNDGQALVGTIIDEVKQGYLLKDQSGKTKLVEYGNVKSVRRGNASGAPVNLAPPPVPMQESPILELDALDHQIAALRKQRLDWPVGGPRAAAVLGAIFGIGGIVPTVMFTYWAGIGGSIGGLAALFWPLTLISLASFVIGVAFAVRNAPKYNELTEKIQMLEEKRDRIIEMQRRSQLPAVIDRPLFTVRL